MCYPFKIVFNKNFNSDKNYLTETFELFIFNFQIHNKLTDWKLRLGSKMIIPFSPSQLYCFKSTRNFVSSHPYFTSFIALLLQLFISSFS